MSYQKSLLAPVVPIDVLELLPLVHDELVRLLQSLTREEWAAPTVCAGWSVKDVALHLLGGDIGRLSWDRDGQDWELAPGRSLVTRLNAHNEQWVEATRRMSTRVLVDLLAALGPQIVALFQSKDPQALGDVVSWAGPDPAPNWLDTAREYTERWHHQQHIRDAIRRPALMQARFVFPVLDTFLRALPYTFRTVNASDGSMLQIRIRGEGDGDWALVREPAGWVLYSGIAEAPTGRVELESDLAWRLFTKGISTPEAQRRSLVSGDSSLTAQFFQTVSIIA